MLLELKSEQEEETKQAQSTTTRMRMIVKLLLPLLPLLPSPALGLAVDELVAQGGGERHGSTDTAAHRDEWRKRRRRR